MRAWTLGYPPAYEAAVRMSDNAKAPGGIVFSTREEAVAWSITHADDEGHPLDRGPGTWQPYEIELPNGWEQDVTTNRRDAWIAYHDWHLLGTDIAPRHKRPPKSFDLRCGICMGDDAEGELPRSALLVEARFINPDTGEPA